MAFLRKIPDKVIAKLKGISSLAVRVASNVELNENDIVDLGLASLGITVTSGSVSVPSEIVFPNPTFGVVSNENINGKEVVDKKSPRIKKEIYLGDRPIYGDWSNGSFPLWQTREVYRRTFIQPKGFGLKITSSGQNPTNKKWKLAFGVEPTLEIANSTFKDELLFAISFLREIVGKFDVYPAETSLLEIADARVVSWEIFPPGQRNFMDEVLRRLKTSDEAEQKTILDRAGTIEALRPKLYILGSGLSSNYYGALFKDDLVVFENLEYGNATYILYDNWEYISQLSRTEILNGNDNFDRIIHGAKWEQTVKEIIEHNTGRGGFRNF